MIKASEYFVGPAAYFITFVCYGARLHGHQVSSVNRHTNIYTSPFLEPNTLLVKSETELMTERFYLLNAQRRKIVLSSIQETCQYHSWHLFAVHVRSNHVHLVVNGRDSPEFILNTIKSQASRSLNQSNLDSGRIKRWARHGSTRYLWRPEHLDAVINYVLFEQGKPME